MIHSVEIGILGPLTLVLANQNATPTAQKQRQVLSLLLMNDSNMVSVATLTEELWEGDPPQSANKVIQTYVLGIRKTIARHLGVSPAVVAKDLLQTKNKGYVFNTNAEVCIFDLHGYLRLLAEGKRAVRTDDDERAVRSFARAENLWRGPALVDVECGPLLAAEVARLDHMWLLNLELRIEAELRIGRYREVVIELSRLVMRYSFHERLHAYLMFALCRSGWRSRALEVFQQLRRSMSDELGVEPCLRLQRLHQDILKASEDSVGEMMESCHAGYLMGLFPPTVNA